MKAAIYCRLSKEDEDCGREKNGESESIQNQKAMLLDYAKKQGFTVYRVYVDEDYSGMDRARPAFNAMLADARARRFDTILAKTQSRFTRDMELVEKYLHGDFIEWGIRFLAVVDRVDTNDVANKKSRQINGLVNEWYLEDLSENVRSVLTHKRQEGKYIASFALYGYAKDPQDKNHLVIDPAAARVVERIFSLYESGCGAAKIAKLLNADNIPNPTLYKQQHGYAYTGACGGTNGRWARSTIYGMLHNETYAGSLVQGRHKKASYKSKKILTQPREKWITVPATHEPIIASARFARVQKMLTRRGCGGENGVVHPLSGKVRCGLCGAPMERAGHNTLRKNGKTNLYLRCSAHARKADTCPGNSIRVEEAEQLVLACIRQHLQMPFATDTAKQRGTAPAGQTEPKFTRKLAKRRERAIQMAAGQALPRALVDLLVERVYICGKVPEGGARQIKIDWCF